MHRLDLSVCSHLKELKGMESEHMLSHREKSSQLDSPEEGQTCDAASHRAASPVHYQLN